MSEYEWLEYSLTWFEMEPLEGFVGEVALLWPSKSLLLEHGVITATENHIEGELSVRPEHLKWLAPLCPVAIDLAKYEYFVGVSGCSGNS